MLQNFSPTLVLGYARKEVNRTVEQNKVVCKRQLLDPAIEQRCGFLIPAGKTVESSPIGQNRVELGVARFTGRHR